MIRKIMMQTAAVAGLFGILVAGCVGSSESGDPIISTPAPLPETTTPPPSSGSVHAIPRLSPGPHMGLTIGFDDLTPQGEITACNPDRSARTSELYDEAVARGKTIGRLLVDWSELEPMPGVYDEAALIEAIEAAQTGGVSAYMTLSTLDSGMITFPDHLLDNDGQLLPGIELTGPEVTGALQNLLLWLVPRLKDHNIWALSLGNEPDANIGESLSEEEIVDFFVMASNTVQQADPDLPTAVTLSYSAVAQFPDFTSALIDELDIMMMNFGCLDQNYEIAGETVWREELASWKAAAKGKPIVVQELTCPVGYGFEGACGNQRSMGRLMGNPQLQADFFRFSAEAFAEDEQLRAAIVFQLLDWSPENARLFGDFLRDEGMPIAADQIEESLATTGLCRWSDGVCRSAWTSWIEGLKLLEEARGNAEN